MHKISKPRLPGVLVGLEEAADAGVFQIGDELALVQTVDFFTPIVDDPYDYGRIAAANSLSDVYAMGAKPLSALNIACYPAAQDAEVLAAILNGGIDHAAAAGVAVIGGHTVDDPEIKYGLAVTGVVHPQKIIHAHTAQVDDALVLTKPLGTGILSTALKRGVLEPHSVKYLTEHMLAFNKTASETMILMAVHAATDITGFGLLGHAWEMATASKVSFRLFAQTVPVMQDVLHYAAQGCIPAGNRNNWDFVRSYVRIEKEVDALLLKVLHDPQTSGGLLVSLPQQHVREFVERLADQDVQAVVIGEVVAASDARLILG